MEPSRELIRNLLLYEFQLNHDAETETININRAKGRQVVSRAIACRWFANFRDNNTELNDQPRIEQPHEIDQETLIKVGVIR